MRITNSMMTKKFLSESNEALNRVAKYQSQVDSTKRLTGIADDPQGTLMALRARNKLSNLELYKSNIMTASSYLKEAESAASSLNTIIQSAYDNIMSAQSGKTPEDLKILAEDMRNLQAEVLSVSNASLGTSYLFGGYNYTGKTSGATKTPPFTVSAGHLIYNGIDMSQLSWKDEFEKRIDRMSNSDVAVTDDLESIILDTAAKFSIPTNTDEYTKRLADSALESLDAYVSDGKAALEAATEFGIDSSNPYYQAMSEFLFGMPDPMDPDTHIPGIADIAESIRKEAAKEMPQEGVTYTPDEQFNLFDKSKVNALIGDLETMLAGDATNGVTRNLQTDILNIWGTQQGSLDDEAGKITKLQIGTSQTVDMTFTGLDLLGTGANNIYHILGKAVQMLENGASPDKFSKMLTSLQGAQSAVLTMETKIGATQNRMDLISSRYDSSELNYTKMRSDAEDADMAESIVNLTTAQSVYNAALAGGAEILKVSLIDFLR